MEFSGDGPARLTNSIVGVITTQSAGPDRGHVEGVLAYLAHLGAEDQTQAKPGAA